MKSLTTFALMALSLSIAACSKPAAEGEQASPDATVTGQAPAAPVALASLTGDAAKGKTVFARCAPCHSIEPEKNGLGPTLHAIVGSKAGDVPGFNFSPATKASGIVWDDEKLYAYLEDPKKLIPNNKMSFAGLKTPQDRADVIAYLKTLK
jgi:cytochrome c